MMRLAVLMELQLVTDIQTNGQTDSTRSLASSVARKTVNGKIQKFQYIII